MRLSTVVAVFLSTAVMAAPTDVKREADPNYSNYGTYTPPAGGYGSYGSYTPPTPPANGYGSYSPYASYGTYKRWLGSLKFW